MSDDEENKVVSKRWRKKKKMFNVVEEITKDEVESEVELENEAPSLAPNEYVLKKELIKAGVKKNVGDTVILIESQVKNLKSQGVI